MLRSSIRLRYLQGQRLVARYGSCLVVIMWRGSCPRIPPFQTVSQEGFNFTGRGMLFEGYSVGRSGVSAVRRPWAGVSGALGDRRIAKSPSWVLSGKKKLKLLS